MNTETITNLLKSVLVNKLVRIFLGRLLKLVLEQALKAAKKHVAGTPETWDDLLVAEIEKMIDDYRNDNEVENIVKEG